MSMRVSASLAAMSRRWMISFISLSFWYGASSKSRKCWFSFEWYDWSNTLSSLYSLLFTFPFSLGICTIMLWWVRLSTNGSGRPFVTGRPS